MKRVLSGLALFALVVVALFLPGPASAATPVTVASECHTGWYVNADEGNLLPTQVEGGFLFDGAGLVHHETTAVALADVPEVGFVATDVTGANPLFKMETTNPYSTVNVVADGKAWSSKLDATAQGGQNNPVTLATLGTLAPYTEATKVFSFGVGYGNDAGNAATVTSITYGTTYDLGCEVEVEPTASPTTSPSPTASPTATASPTQPTTTPTITQSATPSQSASDTPGPTGSATGSPTASASPSDSLSPAAGVVGGNTGGSLPLTGPKVLGWLALGVFLIAVGGVMIGLVKRRRENDQEAQTA